MVAVVRAPAQPGAPEEQRSLAVVALEAVGTVEAVGRVALAVWPRLIAQ